MPTLSFVPVGTLQSLYPSVQDLKDQPYGSRHTPGASELWLRHVF
jgi:hypothetical protein